MSEKIGWLETLPEWRNRMRPIEIDAYIDAVQFNNYRLIVLCVAGMVCAFLLGRII